MAQDQADISARSDYGIVNEDHVGFAEEYWLDLCCFLTFFIIVIFVFFWNWRDYYLIFIICAMSKNHSDIFRN